MLQFGIRDLWKAGIGLAGERGRDGKETPGVQGCSGADSKERRHIEGAGRSNARREDEKSESSGEKGESTPQAC